MTVTDIFEPLHLCCEGTRQDVLHYQTPRLVRDNLTEKEGAALRNLRKDFGIMIKPEDKEPALVIQNTTDYVRLKKNCVI